MADNTILYGTWQFNETIDTNLSATLLDFSCFFNGKRYEFKGMGLYSGWFCYFPTTNFSSSHLTPLSSNWTVTGYRTIRITTESNATVLAWLQNNAVKISEEVVSKEEQWFAKMHELADVINNKAGTTGKKVLSQIVETAKTIEKGITPTGTVNITTNGTHNVTNYASANVNVPVPSDYIKPSGNLSITSNGDYNVKEKESVSVNVPSSGITPSGTYEVTNNGEYDITEYAKVNVNVAGSGSGESTLKKLLDYTKSCYYMFYKTTSTDLTDYFSPSDTENVTNMSYMFFQSKIEKMELHCIKATDLTCCFNTCQNLKIVKIVNAKTATLTNMFAGCYLLEKADLNYYTCPSYLSYDFIFKDCYSLKTIIIRSFNSSYKLSSSAFNNCYHLKGTVNATYNPNGDKDGYIYVPSAMVDTLKAETNWSAYADQIRALEDYTVDGTTTGELDESKI